ncbi:recombinase family protein [Enterovibrio calviensis]|uniref:recombinase family protein n=1 Tax=Enterovibrio calviensis TaxID=91359 RepID=UPI000485F96E|nr:recombinase family protein [Enterovibrio calviensis]
MSNYLIQYTRISSHSQRLGTGLQGQALSQEEMNHLCSTYNVIPYHETFCDSAVSAFKVSAKDRPAFSRILANLESGAFSPSSVLVLANLDRLSRQDIHTACTTLLSVIQQVRVYIVQERRLFSKDDPDLMMGLMMALATLQRGHDESLAKSTRTNKSNLVRIQNHKDGIKGKNGNSLSITSGKYPMWVKLVDGEVTIDPAKADIAREVVRLMIEGKSISQVQHWLVANHPSIKWGEMSLRRLHTRKTLIGEFSITINGEKHVLHNHIEPIISEAEYYRLVAVRSEHTATRMKKWDNVSIFTGYKKSYCRSCGSPMTTVIDKNKESVRCRGGSIYDKCPNLVCIKTDYLVAALRELNFSFKSLVPEPSTSLLPMLEVKLKECGDAVATMEKDYMEHQHSFLLPLMAKKHEEIAALEAQIEEDKVKQSNHMGSIFDTLPETPEELRELLMNLTQSMKFYKVKRGNTLTTIYFKNGFITSIYLAYGKVVQAGLLTGSNEGDIELLDDVKFKQWIEEGRLDDWIR